jgi:hypothetical protein
MRRLGWLAWLCGGAAHAESTDAPRDLWTIAGQVSAWSTTLGVEGEVRITPHVGVDAFLGVGATETVLASWFYSNQGTHPIWFLSLEGGAGIEWYPFRAFSGLRAGLEGSYVRFSDLDYDMSNYWVKDIWLVAAVPHLGYKRIGDVVTFGIDAGVAMFAASASTASQTPLEVEKHHASPWLRVQLGWSF